MRFRQVLLVVRAGPERQQELALPPPHYRRLDFQLLLDVSALAVVSARTLSTAVEAARSLLHHPEDRDRRWNAPSACPCVL